MRKPGFLSAYARHAGISPQAMVKLLRKAGIDYYKPFKWDEVDEMLDGARHPGRDHLRRRRVRYDL
ncbi:hypothetical protein [Nitrospira sp. Nam80]